jgi:hypothetical protein
MKKLFSTILFSLVLLSSNLLSAKHGDSLSIITHNKVLIQTDPSKGSTTYPAWGQFPKTGNFQKVYCELTFQCPNGMSCGEWDYLNFIHIGKRKGTYNDSLGWELMRFITPYGLGFNNSWKHTWKFDITDFQSLLRDSIEIRYQHTGYEARNGRGWLVTLKFTLFEGPSIREVLDVKKMYTINAPFGDDAAFDNSIPEYQWKSVDNATTSRIKIIQTGHGMDQPSNCAEFCPRERYLFLDGKYVDTSLVWRDDCGSNPVYPQNGTWLYDRAAWCPGQSVDEYNFEFKDAGSTDHSFDLDMESYTRTGGSSNYMISAYLISYGKTTYKSDATLEEIFKPSAHPQYSRINPICGEPLIRVRNTGSDTIFSLDFEYGVKNGKLSKHYWSGIIPFNGTADISLPYLMDWTPVSETFTANISLVNGKSDEDLFNNTLESVIPATKTNVLPEKVVVSFRTNNAPTENSYRFLDAAGHIIVEKRNFPMANTVYRDTFTFYNGCFTFHFSDTGLAFKDYPLNEDGLNWWANTGDGSGSIQLRHASNGAVIKTFAPDFGTDIRYDFTVGYRVSNETIPAQFKGIKVYPNPSSEGFGVEIAERFAKNAGISTIEIVDLRGQTVYTKRLEVNFSQFQWIESLNIPKGVYIVKFKQNNELCTSKVVLY